MSILASVFSSGHFVVPVVLVVAFKRAGSRKHCEVVLYTSGGTHTSSEAELPVADQGCGLEKGDDACPRFIWLLSSDVFVNGGLEV